MVGFRERRGQSLVKVSQTQSNLINSPETTRLDEIQIQILIIEIEAYGDILKDHSHTGTQHMSVTHYT